LKSKTSCVSSNKKHFSILNENWKCFLFAEVFGLEFSQNSRITKNSLNFCAQENRVFLSFETELKKQLRSNCPLPKGSGLFFALYHRHLL